MDIQVVKRDGSTENFEAAKIAKVAHAAGANPEQAETIGKNLAAWAKKRGDKKITSLEIRDEVLKELKKVDTYAANMFEWYQRTKENKGSQ